LEAQKCEKREKREKREKHNKTFFSYLKTKEGYTLYKMEDGVVERIERIVGGEDLVSEVMDMEGLMEVAEEYYDSLGMRLSMAVMEPGVIVLSSKHWMKNCYIEVSRGINNVDSLFADTGCAAQNAKTNECVGPRMSLELWDTLLTVSKKIKRELEHAPSDITHVYITRLNRTQTLKVYDSIIEELNNRGLVTDIVEQYDLFGWSLDKDLTVEIPWVKGFKWDFE
jgi:hypothetical protein